MNIAEGNSPTLKADIALVPTGSPSLSSRPPMPTDLATLIAASIQQAVQQAFQLLQHQLDDLKANQDYLHSHMKQDNTWGRGKNDNYVPEYTKADAIRDNKAYKDQLVHGVNFPSLAEQMEWEEVIARNAGANDDEMDKGDNLYEDPDITTAKGRTTGIQGSM